MKKILSILLLAYCFSITRQDIYNDSWALLIGIDNYQNVQGLDYAVKDAESMQEMLINLFGFSQDNIVILKNEEATKSNIIKEFSNITKKAKSEDRVLIFFAGHGETEEFPNGGEAGYFLPVDGDKKDLYVSAIRMDELQVISQRSEAKHILCLVDACYGGMMGLGSRGLSSTDGPNYIETITKYRARQVISAGGRGEEVVEKSEWGHSAFTKNLISGLRDWMADLDKDGIITTQELGTFLKSHVIIDSDNQQNPKTRNIGSSTDEGEFVFFQHSNIANTMSNTNIISKESTTHNTGDDLNWEHIRDLSIGVTLGDIGPGFYIFDNLFLDDGSTAFSYGGAASFHDDYAITDLTLALHKYLTSYSKNFFNFGINLSIIEKGSGGSNFSDAHFGWMPYIGFGEISEASKNHSECNHSSLFHFLLLDRINEILVGYRFVPEEATTELGLESGIVVKLKLGKFVREQKKSATKVLP